MSSIFVTEAPPMPASGGHGFRSADPLIPDRETHAEEKSGCVLGLPVFSDGSSRITPRKRNLESHL